MVMSEGRTEDFIRAVISRLTNLRREEISHKSNFK